MTDGLGLYQELTALLDELDRDVADLMPTGRKLAEAERDYKVAAASKTLELREQGKPATLTDALVKGDAEVSLLRFKRDAAEVEYRSVQESINAICNGDIDGAVDLFDEDQQFGNVKSSVDAPQGRFEGKDAIRQFCANWLTYAQADASYVVPVKQTRSGGGKHGCHHSRRADQKAGHRRGRHQTGPEAGDKRRSDPGGR